MRWTTADGLVTPALKRRNSTQHYAKINPTTLAKANSDAGYFARNVRTIEVLLDRDAVTSGAAASGEPWQYYDLGHGYCTYTFFEQCPHRMACARCDFYTPKDSSKGQLLEAKDNLQRMLASVPLSDEERAAVDDGQLRSTNCWNGSSTSLHQLGQHHARSASRRPRRCCRSSPSTGANSNKHDKPDPTMAPVRLYYEFLMEEGPRESGPAGQGRYTPGRGPVAGRFLDESGIPVTRRRLASVTARLVRGRAGLRCWD